VKLSVIIPAYNEQQTIEAIVAKVDAVPVEKEIIIVDDCSSDGTREILRRLAGGNRKVLFHERNQGKGAAIRTAMTETSGDVVIIQDADLEYDPDEYPKLIAPIERDEADMVYGSRFLASGRGTAGRVHYSANRFLTSLSNLFTGLALTDMETCYKAMRGDLARQLDLRANSFEIEPEITARAARAGARFMEIPIAYQGRSASEGKKIGIADGLRAIWTIIKFGIHR
jgi:glycosyltransferase involved in cell wall biosynthesis